VLFVCRPRTLGNSSGYLCRIVLRGSVCSPGIWGLPETLLFTESERASQPSGVGSGGPTSELGLCAWHQSLAIMAKILGFLGKPVSLSVNSQFWRIVFASPTPHGAGRVAQSVREMFASIGFTETAIIEAIAASLKCELAGLQ
jgi:hypothetical protein